MPEFKRRELSSDKPLGNQLKGVRRTSGLSLEEVEALTKIRKKFLSALEEGAYEVFPAEVYARGFLENYADFLGFPADEVLLQYKRERGLGGRTAKPLPVPPVSASSSRITITPRTLWAGLGALSLFIAVAYVATLVTGFASPPKLDLTKPAPGLNVSSDTVDVEGTTDTGAELSINSQPVPTDPHGGFKEQVRLAPGTNTIRVAARNKRGRERVVTRSVTVQTAQAPAVPTPAPAATPTGLLMTVKIGPNSAYLTVVVDGKQAFQGLLAAGTEQSFVGTARILLTTGNAGSTKVLINGQEQGSLGREGQLRRGIEYLLPPPTPAPVPSPAA